MSWLTRTSCLRARTRPAVHTSALAGAQRVITNHLIRKRHAAAHAGLPPGYSISAPVTVPCDAHPVAVGGHCAALHGDDGSGGRGFGGGGGCFGEGDGGSFMQALRSLAADQAQQLLVRAGPAPAGGSASTCKILLDCSLMADIHAASPLVVVPGGHSWCLKRCSCVVYANGIYWCRCCLIMVFASPTGTALFRHKPYSVRWALLIVKHMLCLYWCRCRLIMVLA